MAKQYSVTKEGLEALETELEYLKTVRRKDMAEKIKVARSFGDLSENSEYDEAKNEQAMMEARIADLEVMIKNAVVEEENQEDNGVRIGVSVKVRVTTAAGKTVEKEYHIVGSNESNPREGKISNESPIGKGLIGHGVGEVVEIELPAGINQYRILSITK